MASEPCRNQRSSLDVEQQAGGTDPLLQQGACAILDHVVGSDQEEASSSRTLSPVNTFLSFKGEMCAHQEPLSSVEVGRRLRKDHQHLEEEKLCTIQSPGRSELGQAEVSRVAGGAGAMQVQSGTWLPVCYIVSVESSVRSLNSQGTMENIAPVSPSTVREDALENMFFNSGAIDECSDNASVKMMVPAQEAEQVSGQARTSHDEAHTTQWHQTVESVAATCVSPVLRALQAIDFTEFNDKAILESARTSFAAAGAAQAAAAEVVAESKALCKEWSLESSMVLCHTGELRALSQRVASAARGLERLGSRAHEWKTLRAELVKAQASSENASCSQLGI